jgi:nicotinamide-nucleotide amidase
MKTAVITVGKEILTGKTVNTNLTTIARKLKSIGIDVSRSFVIDDQKEEYFKILDMVDEDLIIFTGGLGPTVDDISRETVIEYFDVETTIDEETLNVNKSYFKRMNITYHETNHKQALFPVDSIKLENKLGTAPGVYFEAKGKKVVLFPGPPHEMKPMLEKVIAILEGQMETTLFSKGFKLVGTGESTMEEKMKGFYEKHEGVNIAPYAGIGEIKYIFTSSDKDKLDKALASFYDTFKTFIYGDLDDTLEGVVVRLLKEKGMIVSTAESCTGGMLASTIVNVPGSSNVFKESIVTYSNQAKIKYLSVQKETLDRYGAVSKETVIEMAKGLYRETNADACISISGVAGPTGGTKEKPVGLVHFGLLIDGKVITKNRIINGDRFMIRKRATIYALNMIRKELVK